MTDGAGNATDGSTGFRFCPTCGIEAIAGSSFCRACGGALVDPQEPRDAPDPTTGEAVENTAPHRRPSKIALVALVVIVLIAAGTGIAVLVKHHDAATSSAPTTSSGSKASTGAPATAPTFDSSSPSSIGPCDLINFKQAGNYWSAPFGKVTTAKVNNGTPACIGYQQGTSSQYVEIVVIPTPITEANFPQQVSQIIGPLGATGLSGPWDDGFYKYSPSQDLSGGVILKGSTVVAVLAVGSSGFNQSFVSYFLKMAAGRLS